MTDAKLDAMPGASTGTITEQRVAIAVLVAMGLVLLLALFPDHVLEQTWVPVVFLPVGVVILFGGYGLFFLHLLRLFDRERYAYSWRAILALFLLHGVGAALVTLYATTRRGPQI